MSANNQISPCEAGGVPAKRGRGASVALVLAIALAALTPAHACRCENRSIEDRVAQADQIFVGTWVKTVTGADGFDVSTFTRARTLKGPAMPDISVVHAGPNKNDCGIAFSNYLGESLVLAFELDHQLVTGFCMIMGADEQDVRRALGQPILK